MDISNVLREIVLGVLSETVVGVVSLVIGLLLRQKKIKELKEKNSNLQNMTQITINSSQQVQTIMRLSVI